MNLNQIANLSIEDFIFKIKSIISFLDLDRIEWVIRDDDDKNKKLDMIYRRRIYLLDKRIEGVEKTKINYETKRHYYLDKLNKLNELNDEEE